MSRAALWTLLLASVGGFVDAVGFLTLFHLFTAHMSGNSVWFGSAIGLGEWRIGLHHLFPIPLFVLGLIAGTAGVELARRRRLRAPFAPALLAEIALLAVFMALGSVYIVDGAQRAATAPAFYALAALPAFAMGLQNATLRQIAGRTVHTTYVTGVLQSLSEDVVRYAFWLREQARGVGFGHALRASPAHPGLRGAVVAGLIWVAYAVGAIGGGFATRRWALLALALPLAVLTAGVIIDLIRPFAPGAGESGEDDRGLYGDHGSQRGAT